MFKCPNCDIEVEDEGLCVVCWDKQIVEEASTYKKGHPEKVRASNRAYYQRRRARKRGGE